MSLRFMSFLPPRLDAKYRLEVGRPHRIDVEPRIKGEPAFQISFEVDYPDVFGANGHVGHPHRRHGVVRRKSTGSIGGWVSQRPSDRPLGRAISSSELHFGPAGGIAQHPGVRYREGRQRRSTHHQHTLRHRHRVAGELELGRVKCRAINAPSRTKSRWPVAYSAWVTDAMRSVISTDLECRVRSTSISARRGIPLERAVDKMASVRAETSDGGASCDDPARSR